MKSSAVVSVPDIKKYLNRDGLDEYNSLLPHSSAEMQTYVNEWMDENPEASTTVQDGAITERKLADKSVSLRTLADDTVHMLKGAIMTGNLSGNVLSADDAYSAPPVTLAIEGKSTQDGTPTPESPVEIVSLEQVNLGFYGRNLLNPNEIYNGYITSSGRVYGSTDYYKHSGYLRVFPNVTYRISQEGKNFADSIYTAFYDENKTFLTSRTQRDFATPTFTAPDDAAYMRSSFYGPDASKSMIEVDRGTYEGFVSYSVQSVLLNLTHALRSLPDGTHDTLSFAYLRPSTHEGWAWYTPTQTLNIGSKTVGAVGWAMYTNYAFYSGLGGGARITSAGRLEFMSTFFAPEATVVLAEANANPENTIFGRSGMGQAVVKTDTPYANVADFQAAYSDAIILYALATPVTTQLDPVELPFTAAPNFTIWCDPTTGLQMEYVRDANIVIQGIEQAIADL